LNRTPQPAPGRRARHSQLFLQAPATEGDGLGLHLLDARTGADRLVVQPDAGLFFVGIGPFRIDRILIAVKR